jgi:hypothetical protein
LLTGQQYEAQALRFGQCKKRLLLYRPVAHARKAIKALTPRRPKRLVTAFTDGFQHGINQNITKAANSIRCCLALRLMNSIRCRSSYVFERITDDSKSGYWFK